MMNLEQEEKLNTDGVNLLVSILVCYPEIGTINFDPMNNLLKMTFVLNKIPSGEEFLMIKTKLLQSVLTYHVLEELKANTIDIQMDSYEGVAFIRVFRDMDTLSKGEFALISTLMKECFSESLVTDGNATPTEEDGIFQEDFIDNMIGNVKINQMASNLIGIREEGRVMIFNK
ncbi:hypothetical protein [Anaerosinus massiliensis]|uniref:hypothetical protein n=1 Tax=Massilibacillus massiliensis TaxID=1806837 RepID=UPI000B03CB92|nr:hypothetical protein [Massilibacillus massiliensis]